MGAVEFEPLLIKSLQSYWVDDYNRTLGWELQKPP